MSLQPPTLAEIAETDRLLVISDYDGVIAPIVDDPAAARPDPVAKEALLRLARLNRTHVAVLSGRSLSSVTDLLGPAPGVTIVGSHGAESDEALELSEDQSRKLAAAIEALHEIAAADAGAMVEEKPASVALHVRNASPDRRPDLLDRVRRGPATWSGVRAVEGKQVIELMATAVHKGAAVDGLRRRFAPDRVVVLGDDVTDEDAFAVLDAGDLSIKVGPGETTAAVRVGSPGDVAAVLEEIAERREGVLGGDEGAGEPSR